MRENEKNLPILIAELIKRMSPFEKQTLIANLDVPTLETLRATQEKAVAPENYSEPEVYIKVSADAVSFEVPRDKIIESVIRLCNLLGQKNIIIRFNENGTIHEEKIPGSDLLNRLLGMRKVIFEGVVTIEFGPHTLYSTGGGCALLETNSTFKKKKEIALSLLKVCGYSAKVKSNRFSVYVKGGRVRVIEE